MKLIAYLAHSVLRRLSSFHVSNTADHPMVVCDPRPNVNVRVGVIPAVVTAQMLEPAEVKSLPPVDSICPSSRLYLDFQP